MWVAVIHFLIDNQWDLKTDIYAARDNELWHWHGYVYIDDLHFQIDVWMYIKFHSMNLQELVLLHFVEDLATWDLIQQLFSLGAWLYGIGMCNWWCNTLSINIIFMQAAVLVMVAKRCRRCSTVTWRLEQPVNSLNFILEDKDALPREGIIRN